MSIFRNFHFLEEEYYYDEEMPQDKIEEIINQIHDKIEKTEIILRQIHNKSSQPEEIKIALDKQMEPIKYILKCPNEIKKENEFCQAMFDFRTNFGVECMKVGSLIFLYREKKYEKMERELEPKIYNFDLMSSHVLFNLTRTPQSKIIPVLIHSLVLTLYKFLVSILFEILKVKYNISDLKKDFKKDFEKCFEKDIEKDFRSCVGFMCWFLTME